MALTLSAATCWSPWMLKHSMEGLCGLSCMMEVEASSCSNHPWIVQRRQRHMQPCPINWFKQMGVAFCAGSTTMVVAVENRRNEIDLSSRCGAYSVIAVACHPLDPLLGEPGTNGTRSAQNDLKHTSPSTSISLGWK